jgi:acetylglutamate kinase
MLTGEKKTQGPRIRVVKLGGNLLDRPGWLAECARALADAGPVVVVHGGGAAITALSQRLGLPVEKRDGLRVTTPAVAEVVEMVLAGPVNRRIVAALRDAGVDAVGLSGADGGLLTAVQAPGGLGQVGLITAVRAGLLHSLLLAGLTPVVAPITPNTEGSVWNVNADDAAAAIAGALEAAELLQVSDVPGVLVDGVVSPSLSDGEIEGLIARGVVTGGMAAKLRAAAAALARGARAVRIGGVSLLTDSRAGTRIHADALEPA